MRILALDTALSACSVALVDSERHLPAITESAAMLRGHAEALLPMVERVVAVARLPFSGIDRFAVTVGPGTFTGIRVGLAAARGLALATGRPLVGVSTLEVYAAEVAASRTGDDKDAPIAIALDARRGEVYVQAFDSAGRPVDEAAVLAPLEAAQGLTAGAMIAGSGAPLIAEALSVLGARARISAHDLGPGPDPVVLAHLAADKTVADRPPAPLYLRPADAKPQCGALARQTGSGGDAGVGAP